MNAPWDPQQREWLQALGYEVMVPATASTPAGPHTATDRAMPRHGGSDAPAPAPAQDRLARALVRAARCELPDVLAALRTDLDALRRDPAAKRAAWPRLRALRRSRR